MLSVIIPVFNRPRQVLLALDSVLNQRGLDRIKLEIVVVDDCSTPPIDFSELAGEDFEEGRVNLVRLPKNSGPAAARNAGLSAANGELIAFLDSDDVWLPNKLAHQVTLLDQVTAGQPETLHAVTCGFYHKGPFTKKLHGRVPVPASSLIEFAGGCWYSPGSTLLIRRDAFLRVGQFDERLRVLEDLDWFIRFGRLGGHLHVVPHQGVIVFRHRDPRKIDTVEHACDLLARKYTVGTNVLEEGEVGTLNGYLYLERAAARFRNRKMLEALNALIRSFGARMRFQLRLRDYWRKSIDIPPEVSRAYELMARATSPKLVEPRKQQNCEILVVVYSLGLGGTEKHLSLIMPALRGRGYRVTIYSITGIEDAAISAAIRGSGIDIISPSQSAKWQSVSDRPPILQRVSGIFGLMRTYFSEQPQLVHFYLPRAYIIGGLLALMARLARIKPRLVMSRRSLNSYQKRHRILGTLERGLHSTMGAIVGNSKRVVDQLHYDEGVALDKLSLIYNGIPIDPFKLPLDKQSKRSEIGLADATTILIVVANLIDYKGHDELLTAVARIKSELPQKWVLLLVGQDHGIGNNLRKKTRNLGIAKHVLFLGQRTDVAELLRISDISLLCSHEEGFSNALLEAMAAGLPTIATDVGGNSEAVVDGVTGLLVPPKDSVAIGRAILRLAYDPAARRQMGMAGRNRVEEHFSLEACVQGYEALYRSIMGNDPFRTTQGRAETQRAFHARSLGSSS